MSENAVKRKPRSVRRAVKSPLTINPFVHRLELSLLDKVQVAVMSLTVAPIRLVFCAVSLSLAWMFAAVAFWGRTSDDEKEPLSGWRKAGAAFEWLMGKTFFFAMGFWVKVKGKFEDRSGKGVIHVAAPHSTYVDIVVFLLKPGTLSMPVSRMENRHIPFIGQLTRYCQPVFVSREDPNSRQKTVKEIARRAATRGKWPPIILFPEGTCTNRTCLISFKPGAFIPGVPVQPVCLKYYNRMNTVTWTWDGPGALTIFWLTLCQFYSHLEVEFLPVYEPSAAEKADPKLFAYNVRKVMARKLQCPITDHTFEDVRLMAYAANIPLPVAELLVDLLKMSKQLGIYIDQLKENVQDYCSVAQDEKTQISVDTFAEYLDVSVTNTVKDIFNLFAWDKEDTMDFREFALGMFIISQPENMSDIVQFAFKVFDKGNKGYLVEKEFTSLCTVALGLEGINPHQVFRNIDQKGQVTFAHFQTYAQDSPEFKHLFQKLNPYTDRVAGVPAETCNGDISPRAKKSQ